MDGTILPNKEKKKQNELMKPKVYCKGGNKKEKKKKQNGLTKPKGYCRGIGAFYIVNRNNIT